MRKLSRPFCARNWAILLILFATAAANATTFKKQATIVDLLSQSELILHGTVKNVTDGIDQKGIPYTEVTVHVSEALKGQASGDYTYRQFGLLKPRSMGNGRVNLMVTPSAFPVYKKGEETVLFLYKPAKITGLRTTTGLGQGKFSISMAGAVNQFNNTGLFENVQMDPTVVTASDQRVMSTKKGAMNAQAFVGLVKHALNEKWIETGRLKNAKN